MESNFYFCLLKFLAINFFETFKMNLDSAQNSGFLFEPLHWNKNREMIFGLLCPLQTLKSGLGFSSVMTVSLNKYFKPFWAFFES
jgi:hypothetical protein